MAVTTQGTVDQERKSKKRKKRDALGEEDNTQIYDKRHTEKKTILVDQNASEVATDMDSNFGAHNSSRKEESSTNRIKKKDVVIDSKRQKNKKRNKTGDGEASQAENISEEIESMEDRNKKKKKKAAKDKLNDTKKDKMKKSDDTVLVENRNEKIKSVRSKKRKKNKKHDFGLVSSLDEELATTCTNMPSTSKKKKKCIRSNTDEEGKDGTLKTSKRKNPIASSERIGSNAKVVRFSDQVEILSLADNCRWTEKLKDHSQGKKKVCRLRRAKVSSRVDKKNNQTKKVNAELIRGKRFSKEEDEMVKNSVLNYIETLQLGEMGLEMVLKCSKYPEVRDCWKEIGKALPMRPYLSVYNRAHVLFERRESRHLTPEKIVLVKEFNKHGPDWRKQADQPGKHRIHVTNTKKQLTSPMVAEGIWADADDYRLIISLHELDAVCLEDVDWDYLFEHRSGDVCRKRWNQMVRYIGEHGTKSFGEQVEILSKRYCPDLLQDRASWDGKTPADKNSANR